jgi:hypothetical protein
MVALIEETAANNLTVGNLTSGQRAWPPALEFSRQTQIGPADGHSNLGKLPKTTMRAQPCVHNHGDGSSGPRKR